jgi:hypothetical protein
MAKEHLATYLNDHLAGAVVALELLATLTAAHAGTPLADFFAQLTTDIAADRRELEDLMSRLEIGESRTRKASAWLAEKFTELKLRVDDPAGGELRLFESLEALSLGIEGKRSLWRVLSALAEDTPGLQSLDYERLLDRAQKQRQVVDDLRLEVGKRTLAFPP